MKKKSVINLIKFYMEKNDRAFRDEAYQIAKDFDELGDSQLSEYIFALLSDGNVFVPQVNDENSSYLEKIKVSCNSLYFGEKTKEDFLGIINAITRNIGISKFLFEGEPGTGKTQAAHHLARILTRDLYGVKFSSLIDSKLGQTQKNIDSFFDELNQIKNPERLIILFDEIDAIALDRTNNNDVREMGRVTSSILKGFDNLNENIVIVATTNLYKYLDKALVRRFDRVVHFDTYSIEDLIEIASNIFDDFFSKYKLTGKNSRLFKKIVKNMSPILNPGDLKNIIKTSLAFCDPNDDTDYLKKLYKSLCVSNRSLSLKELQDKGFTLREIEILTGVSKSQVARELKE